ncbi:hypothetical protein DFJ58DRAFT_25103 [Suillus subalutaceus]|uniref:uncharacterized protein n=1 Tax=Suillus subalutaceus TaxID=48586 RepID=UPI001B8645A0|nr:uncharacterized protein DFJ58DRAFT_25103 [Suillus subalutaceus]KAG1844630.1 hypothetical protein DFJ58DRAFT_25103 [Suillus subalutaceus]
MIFTSLTTMIISFAAMAGVAIASDSLTITPMGLPCDTPNQAECSTGIKIWNNDNDFMYFCGPSSTIVYYEACSCKNCCYIDVLGNYQC